ncbi:MAG: hypothetical protein N2C13_03680 [Chloroflexota bacterium]
MTLASKKGIKQVLGSLPLTAEIDWYLRKRGEPLRGFKLEELDEVISEWQTQAAASPHRSEEKRNVLIFSTLRYWVSHSTLLGLTLSSLGHNVNLGYLPYNDWSDSVNDFDLRQRNLYVRKVLSKAEPTLPSFSFLDQREDIILPPELEEAVAAVTVRDVQYTEQVEDIDDNGDLFALRHRRNLSAAKIAFQWMQNNHPDVLLTPNGMILEFGAIYEVAKHLGIPVVSYEFGEQRERIWFSQGASVMLQDTDEIWEAKKDQPFGEEELVKIRELFEARQGATLWQNFSRKWQESSSEGGKSVRDKLNLDDRPVVLLAANVIGDSLTLGRQVFSESMTEWVTRTLDYFKDKPNVQFILRTHPGERYMAGPSLEIKARQAIPELPENFRIVGPENPINTYDLISIADLGLVYTTTVGLEMAMSAVPVIVAGNTHYRGKDFTLDPTSWDEYFALLDSSLDSIKSIRPPKDQVQRAWHYAYRFFFDFPRPFPWHLWYFWDDVKERSLSSVLTDEGMQRYKDTFDYLVGKPLNWKTIN